MVSDVWKSLIGQPRIMEITFPSVAHLAPVFWVFEELCLERSLEAACHDLEVAYPIILSRKAICIWLTDSWNLCLYIDRLISGGYTLLCSWGGFPKYDSLKIFPRLAEHWNDLTLIDWALEGFGLNQLNIYVIFPWLIESWYDSPLINLFLKQFSL